MHRRALQRLISTGSGAILLIVISPLILVVLILHLIAGLFLHIAAWCWWCSRGRYVLFVYSDSPIWHEYITTNILPRLGRRAVVLNWSLRRRWRHTLGVLVFGHYGGDREFNPMAIVFRPWRRVRQFRFYEPFREFKHGKPEAVSRMEAELYEWVNVASGEHST